MAKVILADSPSWRLFNPTMHIHLGILYLAGALRAAGHDVIVKDCHQLTSWDKEKNELIIHKEKLEECDVLGLSATTANVNWGAQLAKAWAGAKVKVLGGPHVTHIIEGPHQKFKQKKYFQEWDYLMYGECEEAFVQFCDWVEQRNVLLNSVVSCHRTEPMSVTLQKFDAHKTQIPGLVWFNPFGMQRNPIPDNPDINKISAPAFDLWEAGFNKGGLAGPTNKAESAAQMLTASLYTARGCPYGCTFCADARTKVREESFERIEEEVKMLATLGVRAIRIQDDTYTIRKQRAMRIADILYDYGMVWRGTTRVNLVEPELFKYLASRGCTELGFGIEHGSDVMLKLMEKGTTAAKNEESLKACSDAGIVARAFLMIGFPGETDGTIDELRDWVLKTKPSAVTLSLFQPFPGSDVWNHPDKYGVELPDGAFDRFWQLGGEDTPDMLVLNLPTISKQRLFERRQELIAVFNKEIGSLDRKQHHGNSGTFGPKVQDARMAQEL